MLLDIKNILIIGNGGREHAIGMSLKKTNPDISLFFVSGNAGTHKLGLNIKADVNDFQNLLKIVKLHSIQLVFVGPEAPLVNGVIDFLQENGVPAIGPTKEAAQLEGSKKWAKDFMKECKIPSASYQYFTDYHLAKNYINNQKKYPVVVKYDGLAAGKGVSVCKNKSEALQAIDDIFLNHKFSQTNDSVLIEDFLPGQEASIFAFTDGESFLPMLPSQDHKAIFDGDKGPNTGGMGAYCPAPIVTQDLFEKVKSSIFEPLVQGFKKRGIHYTGIIYAGLMIENNNINVVEFNVRFGDPETQAVLPLLKTNLLDIFIAMYHKTLHHLQLEWHSKSSVCVVLAAGGYPETYEKNKAITGLESVENQPGMHVIHAGTTFSASGNLLTNGGRVLAIVSVNDTLPLAISCCYKNLSTISFEGMQFRKDIGKKAL